MILDHVSSLSDVVHCNISLHRSVITNLGPYAGEDMRIKIIKSPYNYAVVISVAVPTLC